MHGAGRIGRDIFDIDLLALAERRAAVIGAGADHRGEQPLPVADGETDVDEAGTRDRDIGDVSIFLELGDDDVGQRARVGSEHFCQHHCGIGRHIAMRRLLGAGPEIDNGPELSDLQYQAQIRKGGLKALYRLTGINPLQFDFSPGQRVW